MAERMDKLQLTDGMIVAVRSGGYSRDSQNITVARIIVCLVLSFWHAPAPCNIAEISRPLPESRYLKLTI